MSDERFVKEKLVSLEFQDGKFQIGKESWAVTDTINMVSCEVKKETEADTLCNLLNSLPDDLLIEDWG